MYKPGKARACGAGVSSCRGDNVVGGPQGAGQHTAISSQRAAPVKSVLMDQRAIAGIGNIYADEALFNAGIDPRAICSDPDVVRRYIDDPLVHGISTTSHAVAIINQIERLRGAGARVEVPMFLAHGEADRLCLPSGSQAFYQTLPGSIEGSKAPRAELRIYPRNFHEIFNDVDRETVFADVLDWIQRCEKDAHTGSGRERHDVH